MMDQQKADQMDSERFVHDVIELRGDAHLFSSQGRGQPHDASDVGKDPYGRGPPQADKRSVCGLDVAALPADLLPINDECRLNFEDRKRHSIRDGVLPLEVEAIRKLAKTGAGLEVGLEAEVVSVEESAGVVESRLEVYAAFTDFRRGHGFEAVWALTKVGEVGEAVILLLIQKRALRRWI